MRHVARSLATVAAVAVLAAASYSAGRWLRSQGCRPPTLAWAQQQPVSLVATAKRVIEGGEEKGDVLMGQKVLFRVETAAGGLTGYERAMIVAKRLNDAFAAGAKPEDFRAAVVQGLNVVLWRDKPLITVDDAQARALGKERAQVAEEWAAAIRTAMREALGLPPQPPKPPALGAEVKAQEPASAEAGTAAEVKPTEKQPAESAGAAQPKPAKPAEKPTAEAKPQAAQPPAKAKPAEWKPSEPYSKKIVPIISVGEGIQVGLAQVKGPRSRVRLVQACAMLETRYKNTLEIEIYVPISTKKPGKRLARVQGVGAVAVAKYKLTGHR